MIEIDGTILYGSRVSKGKTSLIWVGKEVSGYLIRWMEGLLHMMCKRSGTRQGSFVRRAPFGRFGEI